MNAAVDEVGPALGQPQSNLWFKEPAAESWRRLPRRGCGSPKGFAFCRDAFGERSRVRGGRRSCCRSVLDGSCAGIPAESRCLVDALVRRTASIFTPGAERQRGTRVESPKASSTRAATRAKERSGFARVSTVYPNVAEIPASGGRQPIGALSRRPLFRPSADFTEGDIANSSRKCRACGKPAGLRRPLASRYATTG